MVYRKLYVYRRVCILYYIADMGGGETTQIYRGSVSASAAAAELQFSVDTAKCVLTCANEESLSYTFPFFFVRNL